MSWLTLMLRWALGLMLVFGGLAHLTGWRFYIQDPAQLTSWISSDPSHWYGRLLAGPLLLSGAALLAGIATALAAFAALAGILVVHGSLLLRDPYYNTLNHTVPMLLLAWAIWVLAEADDAHSLGRRWSSAVPAFLRRRDDWISLFIRLFVGSIALRQGLENLFLRGGPAAFAERLYVRPFAGHLPAELLWLAGITNPVVMTACGLALCVGLRTRIAAGLYLAFLVEIVFGHLLGDPYQADGDMTAYALNNFGFAAVVYYRHARGQDSFGLGPRPSA